MKKLILLLIVVLSSLAQAQQATYPRLSVMSLGSQENPMMMAHRLGKQTDYASRVNYFKKIGTSVEMHKEFVDLEKLGVIDPFHEGIILMQEHPYWKTKYELLQVHKYCDKSFKYCLKEVFDKKEFESMDEIIPYIKAHKVEAARKVDKRLHEQKRINDAKIKAHTSIFTQ